MRLDSANLPPSIAAAHGKPVTLRQCHCSGGKVNPACQIHGAPGPAQPAPLAEPTAPEKRRKAAGLSKPRGRKGMNATEAAFALILEARKRAGEILRYEREGLTLRWPDGMTYTPDFTVVEESVLKGEDSYPYVQLVFIEVKGPFIEQDALVKFRSARDKWARYRFEMWQRKGKKWSQVL